MNKLFAKLLLRYVQWCVDRLHKWGEYCLQQYYKKRRNAAQKMFTPGEGASAEGEIIARDIAVQAYTKFDRYDRLRNRLQRYVQRIYNTTIGKTCQRICSNCSS